MAGRKQKGMKDNLDDILGDLLDEDAHVPPKKGQQAKAKGKVGDDNFYSSIAASIENDADTSEVSDADVNQIAKSIGGLDDMDADLFNLSKKKPGSAKKQTTPRRPTTPRSKASSAPRTPSPVNRVGSPTRSETPTSPPNSGRQNSTKRRPPKTGSPPLFPENRPGTSPGKMTDIGKASEELKPGQMSKRDERPHTQPKAKSKYDYGDFDEDDPLAGLLSDEDSMMADAKRPASPRKTVPKQPRPAEEPAKDKGTGDVPAVTPVPETKTPDSPLRGLLDRPPTRSGDVKLPGTDIEKGDSIEKPKPAAKKRDEIIFSDDDDLMSGLGFDDTKGKGAKPAEVAKPAARRDDAESVRSASSYMDSLLGKDSANRHLETPQKREFVLDRKYSKPQEEEDFAFGSYQPSAAFKAKPKARRAVRFQDDDIFGSDDKTPSRSHSPSSPVKKAADDDMDWLTMATGTPTKPSTPSSKPSTPSRPSAPTPEAAENVKKSSASDWLGLKDNAEEDSDEYFKPNPSARKPPVPGQSQPRTQSPALGQQRMQSPAAQSQARTQSPSIQSRGRSPSPVKGDSFDDLLSEIKKNADSSGGRGGLDLKEKARAGSPAKSLENSLGLGEEINLDELLKSKPETPSFLGESPAAMSAKSAQSMDIFDPPPNRPASATKWESGSRRRRLSGSLDPGSDIFSKGTASVADETDDFFPRLQLDAASPRGPQVSKEELALNLGSSRSPLPSATRTPFPHVASAPSNLHLQASLHPPGSGMEFFPHPSPASGRVQFESFPPASPATGRMFAEQQPSVRTPVPDQLQQQQQQQQQLQQQAQLQKMMQELQSQYNATVAAQAMPPTSMPMQQPSLMAALDSPMPGSMAEAHARIRTLEIEKQYAQSLLDSTKKRYDEEIEAIERSYKNRMQILEESNQKKESRLRSENEQLMETHLAKVRQLEQEKAEQSEQHYRKLEDQERSKAQDLERLREQHRVLLTELKREQDEAIERLKQAKNLEINAVANANDTSKCLTAVVSQIQNNAKDLSELQMKVDAWNRQGLDDREISIKSKDEQLRMLQTRLTKQEEDNERERQRLEELIAKMETQLREQTRSLDEERWRLKQELSKQESKSRALEEERRLWAEQQARERLALDRAREAFLEEQRASTAQLAEERRQLTEEKTRFAVDQKINRDKMQQDQIKAAQAQAEYDMLMKSVSEERSKENERKKNLQQQEDRVKNEWNRLEQEKNRLETEKDKLESLAEQVRQRSIDIDRLTDASTRAQQEGDRALAEALRVQSQHAERVHELKQQSDNIRAMEKYIAEEKVKLAKERKEVENLKSASLCANCRSPLRPGIPHYQGGGMNSSLAMSMPYAGGPQSLPLTAPPNSIETIAASIATDRSIRMWKIQAMKDQENLEEEVMFLEGLKHAPYHKANSMK